MTADHTPLRPPARAIPVARLPGSEGAGIVNRATRKANRRSTQLTDTELLADAWRQLQGGPRVTTAGRPSSTRTRPFSANRRGLCDRCGRWIDRGDEVRFHKDFPNVVHSGCRAAAVTVTKIVKNPVVAGTRKPTLCGDCHLEHAGECW